MRSFVSGPLTGVYKPDLTPAGWIADECDIWEVNEAGDRLRWVGRLSPKDAKYVVRLHNAGAL